MSIYQEINSITSPLLPTKDTEFTNMGSRIDCDQYDVVVCGEVKKGKSSFINAIIGDDLLPVNTDVATSQVFRIVNDTQERYELVFIDGSLQLSLFSGGLNTAKHYNNQNNCPNCKCL